MRFHFPVNRRLPLLLLLLVRLTAVLLLYGVCRWLFYIFNLSAFHHLSFPELLFIFTAGIRYDLSAIAITNLPIIFLFTLPFEFKYNTVYQQLAKWLFVLINSLALAVNLTDVIFFRYIAKRTTSEVFEFFSETHDNNLLLLQQFMMDFWYMWLIFIVCVYFLVKLVKYFIPQSPSPVFTLRWYLTHSLVLIIFGTLTVIFARGGLQLKPIGLMSAAKITESRNVPLLINSPFSIIKTFGSKKLKVINYFEPEQLASIYSPVHTNLTNNLFGEKIGIRNRNIVLIIVESLGREHLSRKNSLTPFVDSLLAKSFSFDGYANGKRSIEALPSLLAGIPSLMPVDFPSSPYIGNKFTGLGSILKEMGYTTAFFHGGINGTMGFDAFSKMAGFDRYYGKNEYGNDIDFDGRWGIYDEPFLKFTSNKMSEFEQPFAATIFTLSSHHPYQIPHAYADFFTEANSPMEASIAYADWSLRKFFEHSSKSNWFQNSIFIITADHTSEQALRNNKSSYLDVFAVPIAIYLPDHQPTKANYGLAQHIDLLPTLASLTGYSKSVFSYGRNLADTNSIPFVINHLNGTYKLLVNNQLLIANQDELLEVYDISVDPSMQNNLMPLSKEIFNDQYQLLKTIVQQYHNRMIHNEISIKAPAIPTNHE
jgi:phosphoglycerol transferase MdoB-like AlkP superfamily enzyme